MSLANLLSAEQIIPEMKATERWAAIVELIDLLVRLGKIKATDRDPILTALRQREETMSTGIGFGIAIPHCSSDRLDEVVAALGRSSAGIEFDALDNAPVKFIVLFIVPKDQFQTHLRTLASIAKFLSDPPAVAGAGFINFTLRPAAVAEKTMEVLRDNRLGVAEAKSTQRIVIDFGSPNVAKPMHVGHIRSTVLGDALARIAQFLGHEVIRDNHIGDWGTQFGMVIWGWKNLLDRKALAREPIAELVRIYKETNERANQDQNVRDAARAELVK